MEIPHQMRRNTLLSVFMLAFFTVEGCASARQPVPPGVIPEPRPLTTAEEQYGHTVLEQLSKHYELDYNDPRLDRIVKIVDRLTRAAGADTSPWHVYLFRAPEVKNAAATRGNHVFVWSGMLETARNDDELATVLAHEIAHVLARHTDPDPNEEARKLLIGLGSLAAGVAVSHATRNPTMAQNLGNLTANVTQQVGGGIFLNPYSRQLELEADTVGLMLMGAAKYRPQAAMEFWSRMERDPSQAQSIQFFSTHPPAAERLQKLQEVMPLAMSRYRGEPAPSTPTGPVGSNGGTSQLDRASRLGKAERQGKEPSGRALAALPDDPSQGFDVSRPSGAPTKGDDRGRIRERSRLPVVSRETGRTRSFTVLNSGAKVYTRASRTSQALGEFSKGARVTADGEKDGWLHIIAPDRGFIEKTEVTPIR